MDSVAIDPNNLLLFSVDLAGLTLSEGLAAYGEPADPLVPVGELTRLLDLDVEVRPAEGRISGNLGESRRSLLVDLKAHTARIAGQDVPFTDADVATTQTEIYLRSSLLGKLLPVKLAIDDEQLTLSLTAMELLPVQARLQRMANRPDAGSMAAAEDEVLKIASPYRLFTPPSIDAVIGLAGQSSAPHYPMRYDLRAAGDLLYSNFQGYLASDEHGRATSARVLLQRRSVEGRLFGPLHGRDLSVGDVFAPGLALGPRSVGGRGLSFSTVPLDQTNIFNRIDLRGELPPGYDVELYVNDVLRGSTNEAASGRYEFLNVPLSPGVNVIRTVTYGPRGERKEETQVINVGAGLLHRGETTVEFGAVDEDQPLVRLRGADSTANGEQAKLSRGLRVVTAINYGAAEFLTLTAGAALTPRLEDDDRQVYNVGARTSVFGLATQLDVAADDTGGRAASLGLAAQIHGVAAVLRHAEYRGGFQDENNLGSSLGRDLDNRTELTLDSNLALRGRILPLSLRGVQNTYSDGSYDVLSAARVSSSIASVLVSAGLEYQRNVYRPARPVDQLSGYLAASTYAAFEWQLRATLDYEILPRWRARMLSVSADRKISEAWALRLALGQPLDDLSGTDLLVSSIWITRYGDLSLTGEYNNADHDWRVGAQWNFGLGYDPLDGGYRLTRAGPGSGGSAVFDAFVDANGNGLRDAGEEPVPNVLVQGGGQSQSVTGANGGVFISGLGVSPTARLAVSLEKVDNPSLKTPPSNLQVSPRPGSVARIDYPMQPTGEVMVKLLLVRDDGKRVGLSSVRVQLISQKGQTAELSTEFDGSAIFSDLPAGTYQIQLDPKQAAQLRMHIDQQPQVTIKGDGSFTPDVTAEVKFDSPAVTAAENSVASAPDTAPAG